ncbi:MAG: Alpha/beta hydrolase [Blastococcus sp.]|nr:Alpha/beta hydrolase [Blastococcus sp.]
MTTPLPDTGAQLAVLAAWDVALLRNAVGALGLTVEDLQPWRARLDGIGRTLDAGGSWTGPAARSAAAVLRELSTVSWAVETAVQNSLSFLVRTGQEADSAQELAGQALAAAAAVPSAAASGVFQPSRLVDLVAPLLAPDERAAAAGIAGLAEAALAHAAAAGAAADDSGSALGGLGVWDAFVPAHFAELADRVPSAAPLCVTWIPAAGTPEEVSAWWAGLPAATQRAAIDWSPQVLGSLDGVPAWARDRANRLLLAAAVADPGTPAYQAVSARAVTERIELEEAAGQQVQLHLLDLPGDRVVLALGDLDTADAVGLVVPGIWNRPGDDLPHLVRDARAVRDAATAASPGLTVATAVWLGYRTPRTPGEIVSRDRARTGAPALAGALAGLQASRTALAQPAARTMVVAHSYGTVVVDEAADEDGTLAADAVVLLGSPGMEGDARGLEAPEVYDAAAGGDPVASLGWFGSPTGQKAYGSTGLPLDPSAGHSDYFDVDRPTLPAMGAVLAGTRAPG